MTGGILATAVAVDSARAIFEAGCELGDGVSPEGKQTWRRRRDGMAAGGEGGRGEERRKTIDRDARTESVIGHALGGVN